MKTEKDSDEIYSYYKPYKPQWGKTILYCGIHLIGLVIFIWLISHLEF